MNKFIEKLEIYLVILCFVLPIILAQDSTSIDSTEVTLPDSVIQNNDSTFVPVNSLISIYDSILITMDTLEIIIPKNKPPIFTKIDFNYLMKEDNELRIPLSFFNSFVEDLDDSLFYWRIYSGKKVDASMIDDSVYILPQVNWFGYDTLTLVVSDNEFSADAHLFVNVTPVNDSPEFSSLLPDVSFTEDMDHTLEFTVWNRFVEDIDNSNKELFWTIQKSQTIEFEFSETAVRFKSQKDWFGNEKVMIVVTDGYLSDTTYLTINVLPKNDPPVFIPSIHSIEIYEDSTKKIQVKEWFHLVDDPDHVDLDLEWHISKSDNIVVERIANEYIFIPRSNWFGKDTLFLFVSDGEYADTTKLIIEILSVNDAPVFNHDLPNITFNEDKNYNINFKDWFDFVEDPDNSDDDLIWLISSGSNVEIKRHKNGINFQPKENWYGIETIPIHVWDEEYSDTSYITLHVLPINDPPIFTQNIPTFVMNEDQLFTINLSKIRGYIFDVDTQTDLLNISIINSNHVSNMISQNSIKIVSSKNWYGEDSLVITISDGEYTRNNRIRIKVQPINDAPVFSESLPDTFMFEDNDLVIPIKNWFPFITDVDNDDSQLKWEIINTYYFNIQSQSELMTFKPKLNWNGYDKIKVVATDGDLSDTSEFVIRTIPINDPPSLFDLPDIEMIEDGILELDLKLYMNDIDNDINELEWSFISNFQFNKRKSNINNNNSIGVWPFFNHGSNNQKKEENYNNLSFITVNKANQTALIKPPENYFADNLSFIAKITDPRGGMDIAMFNVSIKPENDAPILNPVHEIKLNEDEIYKKSLSIWFPYVNDVDNLNKKLKWEIESQKSNIHFEIDKDSVTIYSDEDWWGSDTVSLSVSDGEYVDETELIISVLPVNDPPNSFELINYSNTDSSKYTFFWFPTLDVEDDPIEYHFHLIGGRIDTVIHNIESTQFTFHGEKYFESNVSYKWFVEASDQSDTIRCVESFEFIIQFIPRSFAILPNYPNPFNYNTIIPYDIPHESIVKVNILDINGKIIKNLVRETKTTGRHQVTWEGRDKYARPVASGLYFVVLEAGGKAIVRKIMYIK